MITQVDLEAGKSFMFLGIEVDRIKNDNLNIHKTTFTEHLLVSYGFDLMVRPMTAIQVAHPSDDDEAPSPTELKVLQEVQR